jgi:hypothetical protein
VTAITGGMVVAFPQANLAARYAATNTPPVLVPPGATKRRARLAAERQLQLTLFRCIFGNPARPAPFDPRWRAPTARDLARAAYEERALPSGELDRARLTVLADALEEAGCADPDILSHLRGPGPHVRGCWVVDLLLGKA